MWCRRSVISSSCIFCMALIWSQCGGCQSVYIYLPTARTERLTSYLTGCEFTCQKLTEFALHDLYALFRGWVSNFSLVIGSSQLTAMPIVAMLFTAGEFPPFPLWLAPHSSLLCPLLPCSSQWVSFHLFPCDWPLTAHCDVHCWCALHSGWVSTFSLVIGPSQITAMPIVAMLFTAGEFPPFPLWLAPHSSLLCP